MCTPVYSATAGMAELLIVNEEYATPIFTSVSPVEISMLTCVGGCGLGMTMTNAPVEVASDVVIFGGWLLGSCFGDGCQSERGFTDHRRRADPVSARPRAETGRDRRRRSESLLYCKPIPNAPATATASAMSSSSTSVK